MSLFTLVEWIPKLLRRRRWQRALQEAKAWPITTAKVVKSAVVVKDPIAENGTAFQTSQIECAFYFTLRGEYYGGHLRSMPLSDSEAHRLLERVGEGAEIRVRHHAADPAKTHVFAEDNVEMLPFAIWPM